LQLKGGGRNQRQQQRLEINDDDEEEETAGRPSIVNVPLETEYEQVKEKKG